MADAPSTAPARRTLPRWPIIIIAALAIQMAFILSVVRVAGADPAFGIEPDYYEKAVKWDATARARATADSLGWNIETSLGPITGIHNERDLQVTLASTTGAPINHASIQLEFFPHARSAARQSALLTPTAPGVYAARVTAARPGLWEARLHITHEGRTAELSRTVEVPEAAANAPVRAR